MEGTIRYSDAYRKLWVCRLMHVSWIMFLFSAAIMLLKNCWSQVFWQCFLGTSLVLALLCLCSLFLIKQKDERLDSNDPSVENAIKADSDASLSEGILIALIFYIGIFYIYTVGIKMVHPLAILSVVDCFYLSLRIILKPNPFMYVNRDPF